MKKLTLKELKIKIDEAEIELYRAYDELDDTTNEISSIESKITRLNKCIEDEYANSDNISKVEEYMYCNSGKLAIVQYKDDMYITNSFIIEPVDSVSFKAPDDAKQIKADVNDGIFKPVSQRNLTEEQAINGFSNNVGEKVDVKLNMKHINYFKKKYENIMYVTAYKGNTTSVHLYVGKKLVGIVMPMKI